MTLPRRSWLVAVALLCAAVGGCDAGASGGPPPITSASPAERELVVFAAASLDAPFRALAASFEAAHPGVRVTLSFAGSQQLRAQIEHGAPADVFASADLAHADALVAGGLAAPPRAFAENELVVVVAREQRGAVRSLADLATTERLVIGAPEVPVGRYTLALLDRAAATHGADFRARVLEHVVSQELDVRQVLTKVRLGEANAGVVYRTDARVADDEVGVVALEGGLSPRATYPVVVLRGARAPRLAEAWVGALTGPEGRAALEDAGFSAVAGSAP